MLPQAGFFKKCRGVAQPGSASALGAEGRKFESCLPDHPPSLILAKPKFSYGVIECNTIFTEACEADATS
jgi:hypothetical protein